MLGLNQGGAEAPAKLPKSKPPLTITSGGGRTIVRCARDDYRLCNFAISKKEKATMMVAVNPPHDPILAGARVLAARQGQTYEKLSNPLQVWLYEHARRLLQQAGYIPSHNTAWYCGPVRQYAQKCTLKELAQVARDLKPWLTGGAGRSPEFASFIICVDVVLSALPEIWGDLLSE